MSLALKPTPLASVCVVDDDRDVGEALRFALCVEGLSATVFHSAEALLDMHPVPPPGCLVADHFMPGMSGLELARLLRARGFVSPVVLISGRSGPGLRRRAALAGVDRVLDKPLEGGVFIDVVKAALRAGGH